MCGIAGFLGSGDRDDLTRMMRAVAHRGPDGSGEKVFEQDGVYLGHQRLSIIDIDDGHQPMANEDGSVWVTFNGEIYNHAELRKELEACGHTFASDHSDTEVLVHGWEQWGERLPAKLNGMFAFAIWDANRKTLFLARDRHGEKPLYWGEAGSTFLFSSELSAFKGHRHFQAKLDRLSLQKYFAHGFIPSPNAAYQGTHKLAPGHWLKWQAGQPVQPQAYWRFLIEPSPTPPSLDEAAEEVRRLLLQSVERRLMSDVPLGVFLSGGIDSSAAAAAMRQFRRAGQINSFCIGFTEASFDESRHAEAMAHHIGSHHLTDILDLERARELVDEVLNRLDEPLADGSILPTYLLSRFARKHVTVALSGDGGDELFAGYDPFRALKPAALYHAVMPRPFHKSVRCLAELLPRSNANMSLDFKIRRALQGMDHGPDLWLPTWMAPLEPGDIEELFNEPVSVDDLYGEALTLWHRSDELSPVDKALEYFTSFYLPDDILTKVDRAAMLNGLEVRSVFLDNDLVDFVRTLPASYKFNGKQQKIVLKRALKDLVPDHILQRPKKGFGIPLKTWMEELPLDTQGADELFNANVLQRYVTSHKSGKQDHRLFLWAWKTFQAFQRAA